MVILFCGGCAHFTGRIPRPPRPPPEVSGYAIDANTTVPRADYRGRNKAQDGNTTAETTAYSALSLSGNGHAVPGNNPVDQDRAIAASLNKIQAELVVFGGTVVALDVDLNATGLRVVHDGSFDLQVAVRILDANFQFVPNSAFGGIYEFENDPQGRLVLRNGAPVINRTFSRPLNGPTVRLRGGTYYAQLELNIIARAPVVVHSDGSRPEAHVGNATVNMSLR